MIYLYVYLIFIIPAYNAIFEECKSKNVPTTRGQLIFIALIWPYVVAVRVMRFLMAP